MKDTYISDWLEKLAAKNPTPGGGAVAALNAALAASALAMVTNYTTGPKWQAQEKEMMQYCDELLHLREEALKQVENDSVAFAQVAQAYKMPAKSESEKKLRARAIEKAGLQAAVPPEQVIAIATKIIKIADDIKDSSNPNVSSDVAVASINARSALESAIINIEINLKAVSKNADTSKLTDTIKEARNQIVVADKITAHISSKITWEPK